MRSGNPIRRAGGRWLPAAEWFFLLVGIIAIDTYIWVNTSALLYQSYEDWAFDQSLRGLTPSVPGFVRDELAGLFGAEREKPEVSDMTPKPPTNPSPVLPAKPPAPDALLGRLEIPRLKLSVMVREGADSKTLRRAVGHIPGTALPGYLGNVALAGHRDTYFRSLRNIKRDDTIDFETEHGTYRYRVESTQIVGPRDVDVLAASNGDTLTLVTCYPFYYIGSAPKRFIVRAAQVQPLPSNRPSHGSRG